MKTFRFVSLIVNSLLLVLMHSSIIYPQSDKVDYNIWSIGTAYNLPEDRWEVGVFHPLRYGFTDRVELAAHPILFFVMPNISLKWSHYQTSEFAIATRHSLIYPTPLLRLFSMEGAGGIISPEFYIPHMVEFYNELLFSKSILGYHLVTGKIGVSLAAKSDELDERALIDYPMAYHRLAVYYHGYGLRFGMDMQGPIIGKFNYVVDGDVFYIPNVDYNFSFENKGMVHWRFSDYSELSFGYKLIYGEYPYGNEWNLFLPMIDFQLAWD
ncbi:MAG: hypothetical protein GXO85_15080 [Chlorobi bacterium]|nr:hypothetical protein [Chlorobiota bacterium]